MKKIVKLISLRKTCLRFLFLSFLNWICLIFLKQEKLLSHKTNSLFKYFILKTVFQVVNFKFSIFGWSFGLSACNSCIYQRPWARCRLERYPLQVRHKQDLGRGFILLLPQVAALLRSDAGSDVVKPASSFVIQNRQTLRSIWSPRYRTRC